jgi:hypothetical protein
MESFCPCPKAAHAPLCAAQTPAPSPRGALSIPRRLTLAQAEQLLFSATSPYWPPDIKWNALRAARLIAGFKPNPVLMLGAEEFRPEQQFFKDIGRTDPEPPRKRCSPSGTTSWSSVAGNAGSARNRPISC